MRKKQLKQDLLLLITAVLFVLIMGAIVFKSLEGWTIVDALYFVTMTATTVGHGDIVPTKPITRVITIIYALSIIPFVLYAFSAIATSQMEKVYKRIHHLEREQKKQEDEIDKAERKLRRQRSLIKQQEGELDQQEASVRKQLKAILKQEKELEEHSKAIEMHKKKMKKQNEINKEQEAEIMEHDKELEVVENLMEKELIK